MGAAAQRAEEEALRKAEEEAAAVRKAEEEAAARKAEEEAAMARNSQEDATERPTEEAIAADPTRVKQILAMLKHPKAEALRALPVEEAKAYFLAKGVPEPSVDEAFRQSGLFLTNSSSDDDIKEPPVEKYFTADDASGTPVSAATADD